MVEDFFDYVPKVLSTFQYLEEAIRQYLFRCEVMTAARMHGITRYQVADLDKLSLGRLIDRFQKFSNNEDLVNRLRSVVAKRNFIAHQAYVASFGRDGSPKENDEIQPLYNRMMQAKENAEKCFFEILEEAKGLEERFIKVQDISTKQSATPDR